MARGYWRNVGVGLDQFVGTLFGIDADETISSYVGRNYKGRWQESVINLIVYACTGETDHCANNIEERFL